MTKKALEIMNKITAMNAEIEKLEKELLHELTPKIGDIMEKKENSNASETLKTEDELSVMGLSDPALKALNKIGCKYIYDVECGITKSTIKCAVGKDFKSYNEIIATFNDWGIPVEDDLTSDGFKVTDAIVETDLSKKPDFNKTPYNVKIKNLKLPQTIYNGLARGGLENKFFYDVYMMPKKKLLKECRRFGKVGYTNLYNFIKDKYGVVMETP